MTIRKIFKRDVTKLLKESLKDWQVYAPVESKEGDVLFTLLPKEGSQLGEELESLNLKDEEVVVSPKDILFPQQEDMFFFDKEGIKEQVETSKKLIFGIRPCDLKGMLFQDEFFKRNFEDIYYLSRAKDRLIVTIGCLVPPRPEACFCTSTKTGPFAKDGYDLQLVDIGDEYIVEGGSKKGEDFVNSYPDIFKEVKEVQSPEAEKTKFEASKKVNLKVDFEKALGIMKGSKDLEENYKRISERCIYCGGCLYVCPTCTCFNVFDTKKGDKGVRRRNWDACIFEGYTREASGHNPRKDKALRTTRRYEHKLKYDYSVTGMSGCVGCGRCLSTCPVEIGISKFIDEITANKRTM